MRVLFVASEAFPLAKTGGLADVAGALPAALARRGIDVRLMLPAYPSVLAGAERQRDGLVLGDLLGAGETRLIEAEMPGSRLPLLLVDNPDLYDRPGGPYQQPTGPDWPDNHLRFAVLSQAAVRVAAGGASRTWRPDIIHGHDWQAGLVSAYLAFSDLLAVRSVFTIHNLRYQGIFSADVLPTIGLPVGALAIDGMEFHSNISLLKAGIAYADRITTVSPTYAREIQTAEGGFGLDGLLRHRTGVLSGILNGIDEEHWSPHTDTNLAHPFDAATLPLKERNKTALQRELGLPVEPEAPLLGMVTRLTEQKGIDMVVEALPRLLAHGVQVAILGSGDAHWEKALGDAASRSHRVAVRFGYDEPVAHRIIAASDLFLMPSRFEPCGLTQMYAMRYGTLPVVRRTGGLADTVRDTQVPVSEDGGGTGFVIDGTSPDDLIAAVDRALALYAAKPDWRRTQLRAMYQDFSWARAADAYSEIYSGLAESGQ